MIKAAIKGIEYYLPNNTLDNEQLFAEFPEWPPKKIFDKTGIASRRIAGPEECSSDLAEQAAKKLFESGICAPEEIEYIIVCTQTPDYVMPSNACLLQQRLGLPNTAGAMDCSLGCSGFIYSLSIAKGLIETGQVKNVLLITTDTYSKILGKKDMNVRTIFGDGSTATFLNAESTGTDHIGPFVFGTRGDTEIIVKNGGFRSPEYDGGPGDTLFMDGPAVFAFTIENVPKAINDLFDKAGLTRDAIDKFIFHQANGFMLEHLRKKAKISEEKFCVDLKHTGNTVSSSIPLTLSNLLNKGAVKPGHTLMLVAFGVGYSWAATIVKLP